MRPSNRPLPAAAWLPLVALLLLSSRPAFAQCQTGWDATSGVPGTNDSVYAVATWDPDGAGPQTPRIVVGGRFTMAGGLAANRVAQWDPATGVWSTMGSGMNDFVLCFATMPNGDLIAGGGFSTAGGVAASRIARWNGSSWSALGGVAEALGGDVYTLTVMPGGALVAGGTFYFAGFTLVNRVASWDGVTWSPLSTGTNDHVLTSALLPNGDLVVGGYFTTAGGVSASRLARWNGTTWSPLGAGVDGPVFALAAMPTGDLAIGGNFQNAGSTPASRIVRWSPAGGGSFAALGAGVGLEVRALTVLSGGDLVAGGHFTVALGGPANYVARWNGAAWSAVGIGTDTYVRSLEALPGGGFVAGGDFIVAGGVPASRFARACGTANWTPVGSGCAGSGGVPALSLVGLPRLGGTLALTVNNLGSGLPLMVTGLGPANVSLWPLGLGFGPGCTLRAAPDLLEVLVAVAGTSTWSLAIPNTPALAGRHLWNQVVELGVVSAASNGGDGEIR